MCSFYTFSPRFTSPTLSFYTLFYISYPFLLHPVLHLLPFPFTPSTKPNPWMHSTSHCLLYVPHVQAILTLRLVRIQTNITNHQTCLSNYLNYMSNYMTPYPQGLIAERIRCQPCNRKITCSILVSVTSLVPSARSLI